MDLINSRREKRKTVINFVDDILRVVRFFCSFICSNRQQGSCSDTGHVPFLAESEYCLLLLLTLSLSPSAF